jgi:hypothetical protein
LRSRDAGLIFVQTFKTSFLKPTIAVRKIYAR